MVVSFSALKKKPLHRIRNFAFASRNNLDLLRFGKMSLQIELIGDAVLWRRADATKRNAYAMTLRSAASGVQIKSHSDMARSL
jgi:hypothetical protein